MKTMDFSDCLDKRRRHSRGYGNNDGKRGKTRFHVPVFLSRSTRPGLDKSARGDQNQQARTAEFDCHHPLASKSPDGHDPRSM